MKLHIAHANGFPGAVYEPLARLLNADVTAMPMLGHDPAFPVDKEWFGLAAQLRQHIETNFSEPVVLVGHSMGAHVSLKVAMAIPERVRALIMLDPPLIYGMTARFGRILRLFGQMDRVSPARLSKRRRREWPDRSEAERYFCSKSLYAALDPLVFQAWMDHALIHDANGTRLLFEVEKEVEIFRTTPLCLSALKKSSPPMPKWLVNAVDSDACSPRTSSAFCRDFGISRIETTGGHMFPLYHVENTARMINQCLATLD